MLAKLKHIIRYGTHAEKSFFLGDFSDGYYDAVIFNGNMVAYSIGAMSTFVLNLKSPFLIDPQTHAFQHGVEYLLGKNGEPKISLSKLANFLGEPFKNALVDRESISLSSLALEPTRVAVVEATCKFQISSISEKLASQEEADYVAFAIKDSEGSLTERDLKPAAVIAPYFFIDGDRYEDWLNLNIDLINKTKVYLSGSNSEMPIMAQLVISKEIIRDKEKREKVISAYSAVAINGVLIWVDGLAEDEALESDLRIFVDIIVALKQSGKYVFNLYGGYLSILLTKIKNGLDGLCHGLEYGESRFVVPVGGGVPISKYYFFPVHKRLKYADLVNFLRKKGWGNNGTANPKFASTVCDCFSCQDIAKYGEARDGKPNKKGIRRAYPTIEAKGHSLKHYLLSKVKEFKNVREQDILTLTAELEGNYNEYLLTLGSNNVDHLMRWKALLLPANE